MNKIEITWSAFILDYVVSCHGRMARLELVLLTRIWDRVGVVAVSSVLSPIQYCLCFLPPPTLMTTYPSRFRVLRS